LTQAELAAKAGLSPKVASQVKRDVGRPSEDTLRRLVKFLGPGRRGGDEPEAAP
jgi:transcriptional regulator with XRE-family HTH domain